ncbi:MAG: hypothetical protein IJA15_00860 [Clostridia bacterium]|nr:hypothetical protein [Clostridia bacterium]
MNYLPVILAGCLLLFQKKENYKEILSKISIEDAFNIMQSLGLNGEFLQSVKAFLPSLLSNELDLSSIIQNIMPLVMNLANSNQQNTQANLDDLTFVAQVEELAGEEIASSLQDYFS